MEKYVICLSNEGYAASLEVRKLYDDPKATARHCIRIVDEDGEDYLYPENLFMPMEVSETVYRAQHKQAA
ncbi:MAG: hypothetical protein A3H31_04720 [Gallionellales bacterium RIFCSPLOWO2_02_FULL_57_47]|nr:MAG: hypothetical protein A3H31_04720 [Gallionellales bacterium RIFCSPLOWO2_02_FULL_57_47]OGT12956.1 MAG: hypothetical protein A3J49_13635 [Gallionellales bacterium RIFCSPHIGHO2_02_FULL_57_16]